MRGLGFLAAAALCAVTLAACGGEPGPHRLAHPDGWKQQGQGAKAVWVDPSDPRQTFRTSSIPNATGTLKDLASQVTEDVVLRTKGAKLLSAVPFPGCEGEAGLQTFSAPLPGGQPGVLRVGFTQWNDAARTATYRRPLAAPDAPQAMDAMASAVCTAPVGRQKWPAVPSAPSAKHK